jgi:LacI family transcriptional regulator
MRNLEAEVRAAAERSAIERTSIRIETVPPLDPLALARTLSNLDPNAVSGVALVAADAPQVRAAVERLIDAGVAVATLVSDLPGSRRSHFCGIDNFAAGRTAAGLIGRFCSGRTAKVLVVAGSMTLSDHMDRAAGFAEVIKAEFANLEIVGPVETNDDAELVKQEVNRALATHPDIVAVYNLGAGNRGLIAALSVHRPRKLSVVVHELTANSRRALTDGLIDAVLNQDCGHEVRSAIRVLKARADGLDPLSAQERIRLDIFLRDNLP